MNRCIYAYIDKTDNSIVYIGKESNRKKLSRHYNHIKQNEEFKDYEYIELCLYDNQQMGYVIEKALIEWAQPKLNKQHTRSKYAKTKMTY